MPGFFSKILLFSAVCVAAEDASCTGQPAPRLPSSPFPVSGEGEPRRVAVLNITGFSFDERVLALSAAGIVAQRCAELALIDADEKPDGGPTGRGGAEGDVSHWHLSLLPAAKEYGLQQDISSALRRFRRDFAGYVLCDSTDGEKGPGSDNGSMHVAVGLAGVLRAVVVTQATIHVAEKAGLELLVDARSLDLEAAFELYRDRYSETTLFNQNHQNLAHTTDLAVYTRAFALFDSTLTMPLSRRALARLRPMSVVLGWASEVDIVTAASRYGHQVICSDSLLNVPTYMNFAPPSSILERNSAQLASNDQCASPPSKHTVVFMLTDGDSLTWDLGQFSSQKEDWWASAARGSVPIAWTFQPLLHELHPHFLDWVHAGRTPQDSLIVGPSGAGYTYLDMYPNETARQLFHEFTQQNVEKSGMMNMVNRIQVQPFDMSVEAGLGRLANPPSALFIDEEVKLTIKGSAALLPGTDTVVTSRRHCLSTGFGDVTPDSLVDILNSAPTDPSSADSYSVIGVEVWGYGVSDIKNIVDRLNSSHVQVVGPKEYINCLRQNALTKALV